MNIDKYLYETIEDYKNANSEEEQLEIFRGFCSSIWGSTNKRRVYTKTIHFKVRNDLLETEVGQVFYTWSEVEYTGYKATSDNTDWCSLIRQKINNLYTKYFDEEVILKKDYMNLLKTPYNLYYRWIKGTKMNADELTNVIESSIYKAGELKSIYQKQKMKLSWDEYKEIIEDILEKIFQNCQLIEDYENEKLTNQYIYELATEDNFYIKYFCVYLENEMKQWQKKYYGVRNHKEYKRCIECGTLIEKTNNRVLYCKDCYKKINRADAKNRMVRYRAKQSLNKSVTF